jgi:2-polyprenyl-3-methyl-5-hydroxy-6-metoxy-1,4-benzoquinol methylase
VRSSLFAWIGSGRYDIELLVGDSLGDVEPPLSLSPVGSRFDLGHGQCMANADNRENRASPGWAAEDLEHACPRCRSAIHLGAQANAAICSTCDFEARDLGGVPSLVLGADINEWQTFFEELAASPAGDTSSANDYRFAIQQRYILEAFRRLFGKISSEMRILDVGCGNGIFWEALLGRRPVIGVDYSLTMCKIARGKGMLTYHADAMALPFADDQFDLIYSAEVLQCVDDLPALGAELSRVCRPGGRIVLSTLNRRSLFRRGMRLARKFVPTKAAAHRRSIMRTTAEVASLEQNSNLAFTRACWAHFPLPWLHCTSSTRYRLEILATNVIIEFVKAAAPAP